MDRYQKQQLELNAKLFNDFNTQMLLWKIVDKLSNNGFTFSQIQIYVTMFLSQAIYSQVDYTTFLAGYYSNISATTNLSNLKDTIIARNQAPDIYKISGAVQQQYILWVKDS